MREDALLIVTVVSGMFVASRERVVEKRIDDV